VRYAKALQTGISFHTDPVGVHLLLFLREKKKYIWVRFLDPEDIKIFLYEIMGHKGPVCEA